MSSLTTIGLMSGTSLDGTDAVAMRFHADGTMERLGHSYVPFPPALHDALRALVLPGDNEIERMGDASVSLAQNYAGAVNKLLDEHGLKTTDIHAIGVHGQTIRHRPERGFTLQLNHPALVAELTGIDVIADFRSRDVAAGGEGAPLVPAFHAQRFSGNVPRVILNIGGIANISVLPPAGTADTRVLGGDTGPGNMLMDTWIAQKLGRPYDCNGDWAATGRVSRALLDDCLSDPFFALPVPKSTGRELFSPQWLAARLDRYKDLAPEDVARTLTELTAASITDAVRRTAPETQEILVCGGGAFNATLMQAIRDHFGGPVQDTGAVGVHPMEVEGAAFAWLAERFLRRAPGNLPAVTHAAGLRVLGALYPH